MTTALMPPIIELRVQDMKHQILNALAPHDFRERMQAELDRVVRNFDFESEVKKQAEIVIRDKVNSALSYAIGEALKDRKVRDSIRNAFIESLREYLD